MAAVVGFFSVCTVVAAPPGFARPRSDELPVGPVYLQNVWNGYNAAQSGDSALARRPKGNEDQQQWRIEASGTGHVLRNTTTGNCLTAPSEPGPVGVGACSQQAVFGVESTGPGRYRLTRASGSLSLQPGENGSFTDRLIIGDDSSATSWYLTPVTPQRAPMPADPRLDQVTFLTAHNAYANHADGNFATFPVSWFPNQRKGISSQLQDGVRGFALDIHPTARGAAMCHNSCDGVNNPVLLRTALQRMADFLKPCPDQFVTVFLEDYTSAAQLEAEIRQVPGLQEMLFRPDREGVRQQGWPRMSELRNSRRQLLILTSAGPGREEFGVMNERDWTVSNYWSMGLPLTDSDWSCYAWVQGLPLTKDDEPFRRLFVMSHFRDAPVAPTVANDNAKLANRLNNFCEPAARKKPTYISVDMHDLGDPAAVVREANTYITNY
ncbi:phospholipase [Streptomyces sp. NPDC057445]|uniref:phospholipase n=1 Tax=Streptomyces sp. NPDC057445 TaxID=3346136 RepID=UPI0036B4BB18